MRKRHLSILIILFFGIGNARIQAQNPIPTGDVSSASDNFTAFPFADRTLSFSVSDSGFYKPITWGLDLAWLSESNIRRGIAFMGVERVDVVRSSFMPTDTIASNKLTGTALTNTNLRLNIIDKWLLPETKVALNSDHPSVNSWYVGKAARWTQMIDVTARYHEERGYTIITASPFNEPDYSYTGQGTIQDFYNIVVEMRKNTRFDSIRISGGNTLNNDVALYWYNFLNPAGLDEGNTHQLAGGFNTYANFFKVVRANGDHATNDELHNVMEAMVGVEYGMQTGIWWGTAELARGEFVKASDGKRLAYAEHRPNWTAASVYRNPEGKIQAFVGSSERQAATTTYHFISKERDVFYDGHGPQREYLVEIPGGTGYQQGQTNAENVVNITWGGDIQPVINGKYILVNRNSGKVMEVAGGSTSAGANVQQATNITAAYQQWTVTPVDSRIGGDFSYFTIKAVNSGKVLDVFNWSLDNGGNMAIWDDTKGANQQWYLEYAEDGWFYIRSRQSALCLDVMNASTVNGANIVQWEKNGGLNQQWRLIPVGVPVEFEAPNPPNNLVATANAESVRLDWSASPEDDIAGYTIFRSGFSEGPFNTIARNVKTTAFVDNTCTESGKYFYKIKAVDKSLNSSPFSEKAVATTTGNHDLVAHFLFNGNTLDSSINLNHGATLGNITYVDGKVDTQAIVFNGENAFIQLPATLTNQKEITIATWVYWNGGTPWQRIFDFGNGETEYMYLTPRMRFAIKNSGAEQRLDAAALPVGEWAHVAVTMGASGVRMYLNGELVDESTDVTIRPTDYKPILNYIGRGQTAVPMFNGFMDDFRIYNYELSPEDIFKLVSDINTDVRLTGEKSDINFNVYPNPANDILNYNLDTRNKSNTAILSIYNAYGRLVLHLDLQNTDEGKINVSDLSSGIYMLEIKNEKEFLTKKIIINHY